MPPHTHNRRRARSAEDLPAGPAEVALVRRTADTAAPPSAARASPGSSTPSSAGSARTSSAGRSARAAAGPGRPWREIAELFQLDPDGAFADAIASRRTWSGVMLHWPVDGATNGSVELSGLPAQDQDGRHLGYRGFGVCRDLEALDQLAALRLGDDQAADPDGARCRRRRPPITRWPPCADALEACRLAAAAPVPLTPRTCPWIPRTTCCRSGRPMTTAPWC
ncbi:MAG: hypothetical protein MZV49_24530 [Rhodopseudomonas palustris]|nr:hypothetical protein [Rhodopseudomonas palustris]